MSDDETMIVGYYALRSSKSFAEFCAMREDQPPFKQAFRWVRVHLDEAPEWVRATASRLEATLQQRVIL